MFHHRGPRQLVISSSHRASFKKTARPDPIASPYAQKGPRIKTPKAKDAQNRERVLSAFDDAWKSAVVSTLSKDGVLRAAAHEIVRKSRSSPMIERFPKVLRAYAAATMGYDDRFVVETFILLRMKQALTEKLNEQFALIRKRSVHRLLNPSVAKKVARNECRAVDHVLAETLAQQTVQGIEEHLLDLAQKGRRLRHELPRGHIGVQIRIPGIGRTMGMVLILEDGTESATIKALKTIKEFDRIRRSHFRMKRRAATYSNRPPNLRH